MRKKVILIILLFVLFPYVVNAKRGCCSHHGGVAGCSSSGMQICKDGTLSKTCTCTPTSASSTKKTTPSYVYGCMDKNAFNYNAKATKDDGSCIAKKYGCLDKSAVNYEKEANTKDGSCQYEKQVQEMEEISYHIEYRMLENQEAKEEKILQLGSNGSKEVTYKVIVDESNTVLVKEKLSEVVQKEPVNEIIEMSTIPTKISTVDKLPDKNEEDDNLFFGLWFLCLSVSFLYYFRHKKDGNLLLNRISVWKKYKWLGYILYIFLIIPCFIDISILLIYLLRRIHLLRRVKK